MTIEKIVIPDQCHTLGCLLKHHLEDNGCSFSACIVPHIEDSSLHVSIEHESMSPKTCLLTSLRDAREEVKLLLDSLNSYKIHKSLQ